MSLPNKKETWGQVSHFSLQSQNTALNPNTLFRSRVSQLEPELRACLSEVAKPPSLQARWFKRETQGTGRSPARSRVGFGLLGYLPIKYPDSL